MSSYSTNFRWIILPGPGIVPRMASKTSACAIEPFSLPYLDLPLDDNSSKMKEQRRLLPQWTSPGTVKKLLDIDDDVGSDGSDIDKKLLQPMDKRFRRSTTSLATMSSSETSQQTSIESSFLGPMLQNLFVSVVHAKFWYPGFDLIW